MAVTSEERTSGRSMLERLAGAPISWGVCEVPGWGLELPRERVLAEMVEVGLGATELGSVGYLPTDPGELRALLDTFGLDLIGGFVPLVLHDPSTRDAAIAAAQEAADLLGGAGATEFITAMVASWEWGPRIELDDGAWDHTAALLLEIEEVVAARGMRQALHPHLGTMLERRDDVRRLLDRSEIGWTFDTGHLMIGGYDPLDFVADAGDRIRHVHLKDVHLELAEPVFHGEQTIMEGVQGGMFCPMGRGDVPIAEVVRLMELRGYEGWYVLEQDVALTDGIPPEGEGPKDDVRLSVDFLRGIDLQQEHA